MTTWNRSLADDIAEEAFESLWLDMTPPRELVRPRFLTPFGWSVLAVAFVFVATAALPFFV